MGQIIIGVDVDQVTDDASGIQTQRNRGVFLEFEWSFKTPQSALGTVQVEWHGESNTRAVSQVSPALLAVPQNNGEAGMSYLNMSTSGSAVIRMGLTDGSGMTVRNYTIPATVTSPVNLQGAIGNPAIFADHFLHLNVLSNP